MRKYILCEYGIKKSLIEKLDDYSFEELEYRPEIVLNVKGVSEEKSIELLNVIKSEEFKKRDKHSMFELLQYGLNEGQINNIKKFVKNYYELINLSKDDIDDFNLSKQTKDRLKEAICTIQLNGTNIEDNKELEFSDKLFDEIKRLLSPFEVVSLIRLKNILIEKSNYPIKYYSDDIQKLIKNKMIECSYEGIYYTIPTLKEKVNLLPDKLKLMISQRFEGKTLQEIGEANNITRERVRQLINKALLKIGNVPENKYEQIFKKYAWKEESFCKCYNENKYVYIYLDSIYEKGKEEEINVLESDDITDSEKRRLEDFYGYKECLGKKILVNKNNVLKRIIEIKATEPIDISELMSIYNDVCQKMKIDDEKNYKCFKNVICRRNDTICSDKFVRYYDINKIEKEDKKIFSEMLDVENGVYSASYFYNFYVEFMEEYDIRNEYELYDLLKKIDVQNENKNVKYNKSPNILIGIKDKTAFYEEILKELSPITIDEAALYFNEKYNTRIDSEKSYISRYFSKYINNNIIRFAVDSINEDKLIKFKEIFTKDVIEIKYAKEKFEQILGKEWKKYFNAYNLEKMGYKICNEFIISSMINNFESYLKSQYLSSKIIYINQIPARKSMIVYNILRGMQSRLEIFKYSEDAYISFEMLENAGITKEDISNYRNEILKLLDNKKYINLFIVRENIHSDVFKKLDDLDFDDDFYENIIAFSDSIKTINFKSNKIFYLNEGEELSTKDFIKDIIDLHEKIEVYEVKEFLEENYNIKNVDDSKIIAEAKKSDCYYSSIYDKIYLNKKIYIDALYGGNDD